LSEETELRRQAARGRTGGRRRSGSREEEERGKMREPERLPQCRISRENKGKIKAPFGFKVILKYSVNTSVFRKNKVSNTLKRLDLVNTSVLKTKVSSKTSFFGLTRDFSPDLFFPKIKYSPKLKYMLPRHVNTMVLEYFLF
jgi:hypothetical protein